MKLIETKEQLTLNELLRIAYEYGNDNADMPTDSENVEEEFSEWIKGANTLFKKLIIPHVSTRFSSDSRKVDLVWKDKDKTQVEFVNNENGKYIIGCDPAFIPNLWQKFWMLFGLYKKYKSHSSILRINADGSMYHLK